ncbi:MAG: hypothetical protein AAF739_00365 [Pseudomonadota bacterium]
MAWIAESVRIWGFINRRHICEKFGVSLPQAVNDLRLFQKRNPEAIRYCPRQKSYVRAGDGTS